MNATPYRSVLWDAVAEGERLPGFGYELSMLRLVAFVRATGLYDYVHHDPEYARAVASRMPLPRPRISADCSAGRSRTGPGLRA